MVVSWLVFIIVTAISAAFAWAFVARPEVLSTVWTMVRGWPLVGQIVAWVLLLPWLLSLWIWRSSWPSWLRWLLVILLLAGTPVAFVPRQR